MSGLPSDPVEAFGWLTAGSGVDILDMVDVAMFAYELGTIAAAERDALRAAMDLAATFGPIHSPETWVQSVEHLTAERDALQALVNDLAALAATDGFGFITNDLLDRLDAAAVMT